MNNYSNQRKNRGIFVSIFIFIVVFGVFTYGKLDAKAAILRTGVVTANSLNVRKGAGTNYDLLKYGNANVYLRKNTVVNITAENATWYKITFSYSNSKNLFTGYVKKEYVVPTNKIFKPINPQEKKALTCIQDLESHLCEW